MALETGPGGMIVHLSTVRNRVFLSFNISVLRFVASLHITSVSSYS